jgi:hypothetical protein
MNPEDNVVDEAERIVREAEMDRYDNSNQSIDNAIQLAEAKAYTDNPLSEQECVYDFYLFQQEFQGLPDQLDEFKRKAYEEDPSTENIYAAIGEDANTCVSCSLILKSGPDAPPTVKEILYSNKFALSVHTHFSDKEIVGMMVRSLADAKNAEDGEKVEAIVTCCVFNDRLGNIVRRTDNGEIIMSHFCPLASWKNSEVSTVRECAEIIGNKYGNIPAALYMAIHMPPAAKREDPEMWEALTKDFLDQQSEETEQE